VEGEGRVKKLADASLPAQRITWLITPSCGKILEAENIATG
jgi:hypothetical protein